MLCCAAFVARGCTHFSDGFPVLIGRESDRRLEIEFQLLKPARRFLPVALLLVKLKLPGFHPKEEGKRELGGFHAGEVDGEST